ncbi:MAG TPA: DUF4956 domain-containing protein [Gemmataceae bacterium]|nr:DUF4956 domain-containing protein [Gemmataceae bacterium]
MAKGLPAAASEGLHNPLHDTLPEWLHDVFKPDAELLPTTVAVSLGVAFVLGCVVAGIYRLTSGRPRGQSVGLLASLVLLTVLISLVTLVIGNNIARAFSLAGVLAIVRFRTVVEDTRDTGFVIFAVAVGMAVGAGYPTAALIGIPFAAVAALLFRRRGEEPSGSALDYVLTVRVGVGYTPETLFREPFAKHVDQSRLTATTTARGGAALDLTYAVRLRHENAAVALVAALNGVEGIQQVELKQT